MGGDAVGAGLDGEMRGAERIWVTSPPGIADGRDMVDVDAEAKWASRRFQAHRVLEMFWPQAADWQYKASPPVSQPL